MKTVLKRISALLITLALTAFFYTPAAAEITPVRDYGGLNYYIKDGEAVITGYSDPLTAYRCFIPESLDGCPVTEIADRSFYGAEYLYEMILPETVRVIGAYAFGECPALKIINCENIEIIGDYAFANCTALDLISLSEVISIGNNAFYNCTSLTGAYLGTQLKSIGNSAFENCISIHVMRFPASLQSIGSLAFRGTSLREALLPAGLTELGDSAFYCVSTLETVRLPEQLTEIKRGVFYNCKSLRNITIPDSVKTIEALAFSRTALESIVIPDSVTQIGEWSFQYCEQLKTVTLPQSVKQIGDFCFYECASLTLKCHKSSSADSFAAENGIPVRYFYDLNSDSEINIKDFIRLKKHLAFGNADITEDADANSDSRIDSLDLAAFRRIMLGL